MKYNNLSNKYNLSIDWNNIYWYSVRKNIYERIINYTQELLMETINIESLWFIEKKLCIFITVKSLKRYGEISNFYDTN